MKIQCPCGAKYAIDVTPGMPPVQFVCQNCGQDLSPFINELIQQETGAAPSTPTPPPPGVSSLKIARSTATATSAASSSEVPPVPVCAKHHEPATEHCLVCRQAICPRCVQSFGRFCSSFCKGKAEHKNKVASDDAWQKLVGRIVAVVMVLAVLAVGAWIWYAWVGSVPHVALAVRFDEKSHSGSSYVTNDQVIFLHGGTLARYDLKTKKAVWSLELVTKQQVADVMKQEDDAEAKMQQEGIRGGSHELPSMREKNTRLALEGSLSLHVSGHNVWVGDEGGLTHYDWDTGRVLKQVTLKNSFGEFTEHNGEFISLETSGNGTPSITRIDMATGEERAETIPGLGAAATISQNGVGTRNGGGNGLPLTPYGDASKPLDPKKVADQAGNLTPQGRAALPAVVAGNLHQQKIFQELNDTPDAPKKKDAVPAETFVLAPDGDGYVQFGSKLLEQHFIERSAMKAPPKKSALDNGNLNATQTGDVANELLNDIQRNNGGGTVTEDQSRYQATVRKPGSDAAWTGEVIGSPRLFPLASVTVVAGGKSIVVLDKSNKKLWQADLQHTIPERDEESRHGDGPCVERDGVLYVFDEAVLTAFDLAGGDVRWRLPSVGIVGLFFDDQGMLYVNTTTGSLDDIRFSQQIDVNRSTQVVFQKIDPKTGKSQWTMNPRGLVSYVSGKFIYTFYSYDPGDEEDQMSDALSGLTKPPLTVVTRIDPKTGRVLWDHEESRATMDAKFSGSIIQLVLKKEVEVLRYWAP